MTEITTKYSDPSALVRFEVDEIDRVGTLTFNRPEVHNAASVALIESFAELVAALTAWLTDTAGEAGAGIDVLIVRGATPDAFMSGGDLREFSEIDDPEALAHMSDTMAGALDSLEALPIVTIAAVDGVCFGGGIEVALACDLIVCGHNTVFGFTQGRIGVITGWGGGPRLVRRVGYPVALRWMASQMRVGSSDARAAGLVDVRCADGGTAYESALWEASTMRGCRGESLRAMKAMLRAGASLPQHEARAVERERFFELWLSDERREAFDRLLRTLGRAGRR